MATLPDEEFTIWLKFFSEHNHPSWYQTARVCHVLTAGLMSKATPEKDFLPHRPQAQQQTPEEMNKIMGALVRK